LLVFEHDLDFQADSLAFDVLEFQEGLLSNIDGVLVSMKKIHQQDVRSEASEALLDRKGTYVVGLSWGDVHHS
jgi:hypothetical protein